MGPTRTQLPDQPRKENRAERVAREKREALTSSGRKIAIRKLIKAIKESSLTTAQIEKMYQQFKEVTL